MAIKKMIPECLNYKQRSNNTYEYVSYFPYIEKIFKLEVLLVLDRLSNFVFCFINECK